MYAQVSVQVTEIACRERHPSALESQGTLESLIGTKRSQQVLVMITVCMKEYNTRFMWEMGFIDCNQCTRQEGLEKVQVKTISFLGLGAMNAICDNCR